MKRISILFFLFLGASIYSQDVRQSLIAVHVDPSAKGEFKQLIYSYHFLNGVYTGREELLAVSGKKDGKDYIRTDIGTNILYSDRYLITGIGNVLDLKEKKILWDGRANLVRVSNDSAIYYTNDAFKGKYYSVYNFKTKTYGEVKNLVFKAKIGQDIEYDKSTLPIKINFYPQNKPKVELVKDAGYGQKGTKDGKPDPMLWWIDNNNFVYANYNIDNTEISFFKVSIDTKASKLIGKVPMKIESTLASFIKMDANKAILVLGSRQILIDLTAGTVADLLFSPPSNGFSYEVKKSSYGHIIRLNDKDVGKFHFESKNFKTNKNIAAMVKELIMGEDRYQQGMGVWNFNKNAWQNVDSEDILTLVGFITE